MKIRPVKKEEYRYIEDFVFEIFRNTTFSDGVIEKALVREIRENPIIFRSLIWLLRKKERSSVTLSSQNYPLVIGMNMKS